MSGLVFCAWCSDSVGVGGRLGKDGSDPLCVRCYHKERRRLRGAAERNVVGARITIGLPVDVAQRFAEYQKSDDRTTSAIFAEALSRYMDHREQLARVELVAEREVERRRTRK